MPDASGRGYEGDISALNHAETFINSSHGLPSPILENPRSIPSISVPDASPAAGESMKKEVAVPLSTVIDETPPEVQSERSRRSSIVSVTVEPAPKVVQRKRNRCKFVTYPLTLSLTDVFFFSPFRSFIFTSCSRRCCLE